MTLMGLDIDIICLYYNRGDAIVFIQEIKVESNLHIEILTLLEHGIYTNHMK